jgi:DNA repair protein RecO (recombination protein O)
MTLVVTDAVVLHLFDYLESSRIIRLATRELGVQSVLARGVRRPKSRFGTSLDVFASGVAQFRAKPGRELHNLTGFELTRSRMGLAGNLQRFSAAAALAELALAFAHGGPDDPVFDVLTESLDLLTDASEEHATDLGIACAWRIVAALGFTPILDMCAVCRAPIAAEVAASFSQTAGGVVCARCRTTVPVSRTLPPEARRALLQWFAGDEASLTNAAERRAHLRLLREFLRQHVVEGRDLRALDAWEASVRRRE